MIKLNGNVTDKYDNKTLSFLLEQEGYKNTYIAVECNGEIVKKSEYDSKILYDGDCLEVVNFVGGG